MVAISNIRSSLQDFDRRYRNAKTPKESLYFAKLAILELGGWAEDSMDDVVRRYAARHLKLKANQDHCEKSIIGKTYGFEYEHHFRKMLIQLLGLLNVERLEGQVDSLRFAAMKAALLTLKVQRDPEAHTHIKITRTINAPSVTLTQLMPIYDGLRDFESRIKNKSW